ncbi:MAG: GspE/PulE family protein [bacterium]|nr:GspE/PulE family protein [bacterium]
MSISATDPRLEKGAKLKQVFTDLNRKFEERKTSRQANLTGFPYFDLTGFPIDEMTLSLIPKEQAEAIKAIPFFREGPAVRIGVVDPTDKTLASFLSELEKKKYQIEIYLISETSFHNALQQYRKVLTVSPAIQHELTISTGEEVLNRLKGLPQEGEKLNEITASEFVDLIIGAAVTMRSSDIHLEPEKKDIKIRFRVDGVLQDMIVLPVNLIHMLMSRLKLLSGLKLNVSTPQDGRFAVKWGSRNLDMRVSALPSTHGESIVMRILGIQDVGFEIEKLGLKGRALEAVHGELKKPNGMILTTGPTGSGKTTTLYGFLNFLNRPGVKIVTLEDPVEYQLEGIIQTPVGKNSGMDFAQGLRSILRQDPDIVMIGEIRDFQTAETAAQAALTGHVVLSTLHTNDAAGAIPRLLDLGVKPVTLAPALTCLIAQRLLRRICDDCKESYQPVHEELQRVKIILSQISPKSGIKIPEILKFYRSRGCKECHNLGYKGRTGVFEVFVVNDSIQDLIYKQASTHEIKKAALDQGMLTMQQDGMLKAIEGLTDLSEVWRVTEE